MAEVTERFNRNDTDLGSIRDAIDEVDERLVGLLNERMRLALAANAAKLVTNNGVLDAERERRVLEKVHDMNEGPLTNAQLTSIYSELMAQSRMLQNNARLRDSKRHE